MPVDGLRSCVRADFLSYGERQNAERLRGEAEAFKLASAVWVFGPHR
jgi:hypothetical protein